MENSQRAQPLAAIKFLTGPLNGSTFDIIQPITTIGRHNSNDLMVADPKVSRFHARLIMDDGSWRIERVSQTSIITVDQQSIEQSTLSHNAIVELGDNTSFLFLLTMDDNHDDAGQIGPSPVSLSADAPVAMAGEPVLAVDQEDSEQHLEVTRKQSSPDIPQELAVRPPGTEIASLTALGIPSLHVRDN